MRYVMSSPNVHEVFDKWAVPQVLDVGLTFEDKSISKFFTNLELHNSYAKYVGQVVFLK